MWAESPISDTTQNLMVSSIVQKEKHPNFLQFCLHTKLKMILQEMQRVMLSSFLSLAGQQVTQYVVIRLPKPFVIIDKNPY